MSILFINRRRATTTTLKASLRRHIEQLSFDQQWDFILAAFQLIAARPQLRPAAAVIHNRRRQARPRG